MTGQQGPALTSSALPGHVIVSCARCGHDWPEGDPGVRYASGDFWCNWENECDDRMAARTCGCGHPHLPGTVMCHVCDLPLAKQGASNGVQ